MDLRKVSNDELLSDIKRLAADERKITTEILHHLKEIEIRRLHLQLGYSSLYEYSVKELGYSEGSAYRRINAMRLLKSVPEVESKIQEGSITLDGAAKIQRLIQNQTKEISLPQIKLASFAIPKFETKEQKLNLITSLENKSLKEIDKEIIKINPFVLKKENVRQISDEKIELKIIIDQDLKRELDHLRNLLSHRNPNMTYLDLIKYLTKMGLKKFDLAKKPTPQQLADVRNHIQKVEDAFEKAQRNAYPQRIKAASSDTRHIPSAVKQEVYLRDKGCCTYQDPRTRKRCDSRTFLHYDHRYPFSLGGETNVANLRLLCSQHHKMVTENVREMGVT